MQDNEKEQRADGYKNLMNKYGTQDDASEQYRFESDAPVTDVELTLNYEENGLFSKIIDIPADDAVSSGFSYGVNDLDLEAFINDSLDELDFEEKAATAIKWSRLYGGALMVMIVDDGKDIEEPVDWDNIRGIDELLVFERPLITPDYNSIYNHDPKDGKRTVGCLHYGKVWVKTGKDALPKYREKVYMITSGDEAGVFTTSADTAPKVEINAIFLGETDNGIANAEFLPGSVPVAGKTE